MAMTEDDTPFRPTRTQTIFKNAANVTLRGNTYDAKHMDKFINSSFGEKSIQMGASAHHHLNSTIQAGKAGPGGGGGSNMLSYLLSGTTNSIKPSVSFISMSRDEYKQIKYYDENDGPSPL